MSCLLIELRSWDCARLYRRGAREQLAKPVATVVDLSGVADEVSSFVLGSHSFRVQYQNSATQIDPQSTLSSQPKPNHLKLELALNRALHGNQINLKITN